MFTSFATSLTRSQMYRIAEALINAAAEGGGTVGRSAGRVRPTAGYAVSVKGAEMRLPKVLPPESMLVQWLDFIALPIADLQEELSGRVAYFGVWRDGDHLYFDVSLLVGDLEEALKIGEDNGQKAVWDFARNESVSVLQEEPAAL